MPELDLKKDEPRSSIEVKRTAKGTYTWSIKRYLEDFDKAVEQIEAMDKKLNEKFKGASQ